VDYIIAPACTVKHEMLAVAFSQAEVVISMAFSLSAFNCFAHQHTILQALPRVSRGLFCTVFSENSEIIEECGVEQTPDQTRSVVLMAHKLRQVSSCVLAIRFLL